MLICLDILRRTKGFIFNNAMFNKSPSSFNNKMKIEIETRQNLQNIKQEQEINRIINKIISEINLIGLKVISYTMPKYKEDRK